MAAPHPITRKDIDRLAVPAIISGIAEPLIALVDTAFVGSLGTADLGAVGIASSFFLLVVWVLAQTRSAVLSVVARYYGEQRLAEVRGLVPIAIWMNVGLGIFFHLATGPFAEDIFRLYNAEGAVLSKAVDYFHIRSIGFPLSLATFAITGAFRGIQNLSWSMWISLLGAAVNLALNPLLIFGWGPMAGMGIEGSAWASVIAQAVMCATALVMLRTRTTFPLWPKRWHHPELKALWLLSGNLFARTMALNACYYLGNRYATGYGEAHIGAHSIAMQIWLFSAFFIDGYAAAGSVLAGRLNGERNWGDLHRMSWQVVRISVLIGAALAAAYALAYPWIGPLFTDDPAVQDLFHGVFWMVILTQPINAVAFAFDGIFKGVGDGAALRNALLFSTLLVFVPVAWAGHLAGWELYGVWGAFLAWMTARGAWLTVVFQRRRRPHGTAGGARTFGA